MKTAGCGTEQQVACSRAPGDLASKLANQDRVLQAGMCRSNSAKGTQQLQQATPQNYQAAKLTH